MKNKTITLQNIKKLIEGCHNAHLEHKNYAITKIHQFYDNLSKKYIDKNEQKELLKLHNSISKDIKINTIAGELLLDRKGELLKFKLMNTQVFNKLVRQNNSDFIMHEKLLKQDYFNTTLSNPLNSEQQTAILTDEINTLVVAGAGCGKTTTIIGKVKYLIEHKDVKPREILIISFSNNSTDELNERFKKENIDTEAVTFHKYANELIGKKYNISNNDQLLKETVQTFFDHDLLLNSNLLIKAFRFFAIHIYNANQMRRMQENPEAYNKKEKISTIKNEINHNKINHLTIKDEYVHSQEEAMIANFLFLNGIEYEYERQYPKEINNTIYKPDFYLPKYDIYWEHFGVDLKDDHKNEITTDNFIVPWLSNEESMLYLERINQKRNHHKNNQTKLIESYSFWNKKYDFLIKIKELLVEHNVKFSPISDEELKNAYTSYIESQNISNFGLFCNFITLFKANGYDSFETIRSKPGLYERDTVFLDLAEKIFEKYNDTLKANNKIDFSDMINNAKKEITANRHKIKHIKYLLIDEFQDINKGRYEFIKQIQKHSGCKLFCVGDDWQSIYRFSGSDISFFTNFLDYFPDSEIVDITHNYRNTQEIIDISSKFIQKNTAQHMKKLQALSLLADEKDSMLISKYKIFDLNYYDAKKTNLGILSQLIEIIDEIIKTNGLNPDILLLGRYTHDFTNLKKYAGKFPFIYFEKNCIIKYNKQKEIEATVRFMTCHKAKGIEAKNVIILIYPNDSLGFPNKIVDDPILRLVLSGTDNYLYAEERRLFYVALTRAQHKTYILSGVNSSNESSIFVKEIENIYNEYRN